MLGHNMIITTERVGGAGIAPAGPPPLNIQSILKTKSILKKNVKRSLDFQFY
jgi:hypothetical protein